MLCGVVQQYYRGEGKYRYIPVAAFAEAFQKTDIAQQSWEYLEQPYQAPNKKCQEALITHRYALTCKLTSVLVICCRSWFPSKSLAQLLAGLLGFLLVSCLKEGTPTPLTEHRWHHNICVHR